MNIFTQPDGNWGAKDDDGIWDGMVGLVARNVIKLIPVMQLTFS